LSDLSFLTEFGILTNLGTPNAAHNSWIFGVVNAAPYVASAAWCVYLTPANTASRNI
jgi:hypothetical protein